MSWAECGIRPPAADSMPEPAAPARPVGSPSSPLARFSLRGGRESGRREIVTDNAGARTPRGSMAGPPPPFCNSLNRRKPENHGPGRVRPGKPDSRNPGGVAFVDTRSRAGQRAGPEEPRAARTHSRWGLDVKVNALASLDPPTVERIKELMGQRAAVKPAASAPAAPKPATALSSAPGAAPQPPSRASGVQVTPR